MLLRIVFPIVFVIMASSVTAQTREVYYDYSWKPVDVSKAAFYSIIQKTDSGWLQRDYFLGNKQLQMKALFKDSSCKIKNGYGTWLYANGKISAAGRFINNKLDGVCISYHRNGMMSDSAFFNNGRPVGMRLRWHSNGYVSDSIGHVNDSVDVMVSWFDDGSPSAGGRLLYEKKNGTWNYFHRNGAIAAKIVYQKGDILSETYYNEDGSEVKDSKEANREASFKKGDKEWTSYLSNNLYWPKDLQLTNPGAVTVVVAFVINEKGKIESADIDTPVHPEFDKIALKIIRNSPDWNPGIYFNRKAKAYRRQPMVFQQD